MLQALTIAGGVAFILFGARFLRKGLDRLLGNRLPAFMRRLAQTRLRAFLAGLGVAVVAPSSTTVSVLAVQTVHDGHLPPRRVLPVMLGANVGLTVIVTLIALRLDALAPVLVLLGVLLFQFNRHDRTRGIGQIILSVGFIFTGMNTIGSAASALAHNADLLQLLDIAARYPALLAALAAILAVVLQSSTATIGLAIGFGGVSLGRVEPFALALPVVIGANVGVGLTLLMVGWSRLDSRRLAWANLFHKLAIAAPAVLTLPLWLPAFTRLNLLTSQAIAAAHLGFNLLMAAVFLPLVGPVFRLVCRLTPPPPAAATPPPFGPIYIDNHHIDGVALALGQARQEVVRVSAIVRSMLDDLWLALLRRDPDLARSVQDRDDRVDLLDRQIKRFLTRVVGEDADGDASHDVMSQLRYLNELETIGDVIDRNLAEIVVKRARFDVWFSDPGWAELDGFYRKVAENLLIAETAFNTRNPLLAQQLLRHKQSLSEEEHRLRDAHFNRLRLGQTQSHESSALHLDILTHLKRINSCVTHVAYAIVQIPNPEQATQAHPPGSPAPREGLTDGRFAGAEAV